VPLPVPRPASPPAVVIFLPCGYRLEQTVEQPTSLTEIKGWAKLPAVRSGQVYAVDGSWYFNRPGPRVVDGIEMLNESSALLHIENLQPSTDGEKRKIAIERFRDQLQLHFVAFVVGRFGFRCGAFAVARRVHVDTAGEKHAGQTVERNGIVSRTEDGFYAGEAQGSGVRNGLGG